MEVRNWREHVFPIVFSACSLIFQSSRRHQQKHISDHLLYPELASLRVHLHKTLKKWLEISPKIQSDNQFQYILLWSGRYACARLTRIKAHFPINSYTSTTPCASWFLSVLSLRKTAFLNTIPSVRLIHSLEPSLRWLIQKPAFSQGPSTFWSSSIETKNAPNAVTKFINISLTWIPDNYIEFLNKLLQNISGCRHSTHCCCEIILVVARSRS